MKIQLFMIFAAVLLVGCSTAPTVEQSEPIKIGFLSPLSGSLASWGIPNRNGALLAVKEINAQGGINGRMVDLIAEDDKCQPQESITATNKLITIDKVVAITGTICSGTTIADAPIAEENGVVLLSIASSNPSITTAGDYIFRMWPSDAFNGEILANVALKDGNSKVAMLTINNEYGKGVSEVFREKFTQNGGAIIAEETFTQGANDFRTSLTKIKSGNPQALVVFMNDEAPAIHKQMRELGMTLQVYGTETYDAQSLIDAANGDLEGTIFTMPAFDETGPVQEFRAKYVTEFGEEPGQTIVAVYAYDATKLLLEGLKQDPSGASLNKYLYTVKDRDTVGGKVSFDANGDVLRDFAQKTIINDTIVVIAKV